MQRSTQRYGALAFSVTVSISSAAADECDAIVGNLVAQVPGLSAGGRSAIDGSGDLFDLHHKNAQALSITCPGPEASWPVLNIDWIGLPPPEYFNLVGLMGSALTGVSVKAITKAALKCQKTALADENELANFEAEGITFECQAFTRDGGSTTLTLAKHTSQK